MRRAAAQLDGDDAREAPVGAAVLQKRALHGAEQHLAVGRDGEALHALVGDAADRVVRDFLGA